MLPCFSTGKAFQSTATYMSLSFYPNIPKNAETGWGRGRKI